MGAVRRMSSDRASLARKAALRTVARENHEEYMDLYREELQVELAEGPLNDTARKAARNRAWTRIRPRHEDRYQELYWEARNKVQDIPAAVRSQAWQRATKRLQVAEQTMFRELLTEDGSWAERRVRAVVKLRERNMALFDRYYLEEVEHLLDGREK